MGTTVIHILNRTKTILTASALVMGIATAGMLLFTQASASAVTSCTTQDKYPDTNILYCGLNGGTSTSALISSFQTQYKNNDDGHGHTDIQTAYNDTGASNSLVSGMTTSNTKLGSANTNGTVTVNGTVVAKDINIGARWVVNGNNTFKHVEGDVYLHPYTTDFFGGSTSSVPVLVHYDSTGTADFIAAEPCGNMITFTAVTPPPAPKSISCDSLTPQPGATTDTTIDYTFVAKATPKNVSITDYAFDFGNGTTQTISSNAASVTSQTAHYTLDTTGKTITITVTVNGGGVSGTCTASVKLPPSTPKPQSLACVSLTANPQGNNTYTFTAVAKSTNTTITSYAFNFGDNSAIETDTTSATTDISGSHTYAPGTYTASFTATGPNSTTPAIPACTAPITIASTTPTPTPTPTQPTALVNTGAGNVVEIFGATSVIGALFYHFILRRKLVA